MAEVKKTKASILFRERQSPLVRVKLPVSVLGAPLFSGCTLSKSLDELALHVGTAFPSGPSLRLSYFPANALSSSKPDAAQQDSSPDDRNGLAVDTSTSSPLAFPRSRTRPLLLGVVKAGLGRRGSTEGAALSVSLEVDMLQLSNSRVRVKMEPRMGDLSLRHFSRSPAPALCSPLSASTAAHPPRPRGAASAAPADTQLSAAPCPSCSQHSINDGEGLRVLGTCTCGPPSNGVMISAGRNLEVTSLEVESSSGKGAAPAGVASGSGMLSSLFSSSLAPSSSGSATATSSSPSSSLSTSLSPSLSSTTASHSYSSSSPSAASRKSTHLAAGGGLTLALAVNTHAGSMNGANDEQRQGVRDLPGAASEAGGHAGPHADAAYAAGVSASQCLRLVRHLRSSGWDVAVRSSVPLGGFGVAKMCWRLRTPGDELPSAFLWGSASSPVASSPVASASSGDAPAAAAQAAPPLSSSLGAPLSGHRPGPGSRLLCGRPLLLLSKLSFQFHEKPQVAPRPLPLPGDASALGLYPSGFTVHSSGFTLPGAGPRAGAGAGRGRFGGGSESGGHPDMGGSTERLGTELRGIREENSKLLEAVEDVRRRVGGEGRPRGSSRGVQGGADAGDGAREERGESEGGEEKGRRGFWGLGGRGKGKEKKKEQEKEKENRPGRDTKEGARGEEMEGGSGGAVLNVDERWHRTSSPDLPRSLSPSSFPPPAYRSGVKGARGLGRDFPVDATAGLGPMGPVGSGFTPDVDKDVAEELRRAIAEARGKQ